MKKSRYTVYGSSIDALIDKHLDVINRGVLSIVGKDELEAVILCGGYGRGEGGVFIDAEGNESLYNDYDMFVIIKPMPQPRKAIYQSLLKKLGHSLEKDFGIEVDFGPLKTLEQMRKSPFTLFNYELKYGHTVTYGSQDILGVMPVWDGNSIPVMEAVKLLLNRGVGLFLSKEKLTNAPDSAATNEFVTRNIYKGRMAIGDAALMCERTYHYSYLKRLELMKAIRESRIVTSLDIYDDYVSSMEYKLRPRRDIFDKRQLTEMLESNVEKLVKMFYIAAAKAFKSDDEATYNTFARGFIGDCNPVAVFRNMLLNLKTFRLAGFNPVWFMKYPRMRLFYCLPYVLDCEEKPAKADVCRVLGIKESDDIRQRFINLWERYG